MIGEKLSYTHHKEGEPQNRLVGLDRLNHLHQLIDVSTRVASICESLLDLIITNSPGYILHYDLILPLCEVDHHGAFCKIKLTNFHQSKK